MIVHSNCLDYVGHIYSRQDKVVGVLLSDKDYPKRVAHTLLNKILDDFVSRYPVARMDSTTSYNFPELDGVSGFIVCLGLTVVFVTVSESGKCRYNHESTS